ncbi:CoA transferase [Chloroflexi bacterium]|nr:CoA transferase [Chloroflexota bacterium]
MNKGILSNIRVVELSQLIAIPYATKLMGDMGAEIIRLESAKRPDAYRLSDFYNERLDGQYWNRAVNFNEQNRNKLGFALELDHENGLKQLYDLISISDVFACNFTPRVMKRFGLEYEHLRTIKPDIIVISSTGYGHTGPWSSFGAIGFGTEAASGLSSATGYENGPPAQPEIPYPDYTAAEHTVFGIMAAVIHRAKTGQGQFIEVAQAECVTSTIPEIILEYTANEIIPERIGNSHPEISPHGCYPCRGNDKWISIVAQSQNEWIALSNVLFPEITPCDKFASNDSRILNRQDLDKLISSKTKAWDHLELMDVLQKEKVTAGAVLNGKELLFNEHLLEREFFELVSHQPSTQIPTLPYPGLPWKMSDVGQSNMIGAPIFGQHNETILKDYLGLGNESYQNLRDEGAISEKIDILPKEITVSRENKVKEGSIYSYDPNFETEIKSRFKT